MRRTSGGRPPDALSESAHKRPDVPTRLGRSRYNYRVIQPFSENPSLRLSQKSSKLTSTGS